MEHLEDEAAVASPSLTYKEFLLLLEQHDVVKLVDVSVAQIPTIKRGLSLAKNKLKTKAAKAGLDLDATKLVFTEQPGSLPDTVTLFVTQEQTGRIPLNKIETL